MFTEKRGWKSPFFMYIIAFLFLANFSFHESRSIRFSSWPSSYYDFYLKKNQKTALYASSDVVFNIKILKCTQKKDDKFYCKSIIKRSGKRTVLIRMKNSDNGSRRFRIIIHPKKRSQKVLVKMNHY